MVMNMKLFGGGYLRRFFLRTLLLVLLGLSSLFSVIHIHSHKALAQGSVPQVGGQYYPITPARIVDTRCSLGLSPLLSGVAQRLNVLAALAYEPLGSSSSSSSDVCPNSSSNPVEESTGIPSHGVSAVVLNVTVINNSSTSSGYLSLSPDDLSAVAPMTSSIDYAPSEVKASQVTVGISPTGVISFLNTLAGGDETEVDVLIDVEGWYSSSSLSNYSQGDTYVPLSTPAVMEDSLFSPCAGSGYNQFSSIPTSSSDSASLNLVGASSLLDLGSTCSNGTAPIPSSGSTADAVVLSVTAEDSAGSSSAFLSVNGSSTSFLNLSPGETTSNTVTAKLGTGGITIQAQSAYGVAATTNSITMQVDLIGYYSTQSTDSVFVPLATPSRIANSINCSPNVPSGFSSLPTSASLPNEDLTIQNAPTFNGCSQLPGVIPNSGTVTSLVTQVATDNTSSVSTLLAILPQAGQTNEGSVSDVAPGSSIEQSESYVTVPTGGQINLVVSPLVSGTSLTNLSINLIVDVTGYFISSSISPPVTQGSYYFPLVNPARIANSSCSTPYGLSGPFSNNSIETLQVDNAPAYSSCTSVPTPSGVPTSGVSAVALNITAVSPSTSGYLTVAPTISSSPPPTSTLNFQSGVSAVAAEITVELSSAGSVDIYAGLPSGTVNVLVDVVGYYGTNTTSGDPYTPLNPIRIVDSRTPCRMVPIASSVPESLNLDSTKSCSNQLDGLPGTSLVAVAINITVIAGSTGGWLSVYPANLTSSQLTLAQATSSLNFSSNQIVSNLAVVTVPNSGSIVFENSSASPLELMVDLQGYYSTGTITGDAFVPVIPERIADSRSSCPSSFYSPSFGQPATLKFGGSTSYISCPGSSTPGSLPTTSVEAVAATVTAIDTSSTNPGYLATYSSSSPPVASSSTLIAGSNAVATPLLSTLASNSSLEFDAVLNNQDQSPVQLVVDVYGYFIGSTKSVIDLAGTGIYGNGTPIPDGQLAVNSNLNSPMGVATDSFGYTYIADSASNTIVRVDYAGLTTVIAGTGTAGFNGDNIAATSAELNDPRGIVTDSNGDIFIADSNNCLVRELTSNTSTQPPSYNIKTVVGDDGGGSGGPVCSSTLPVNGATANTTAIGTADEVFVDNQGDIFVAVTESCALNETFGAVYEIPNQSGTYYGITMNAGSIYTILGTGVCGSLNLTGTALSSSVKSVAGMAVGLNQTDNLYVADPADAVVWQINSSGSLSVFAGTVGNHSFSGDGGLAANATMCFPSDIAIDPLQGYPSGAPANQNTEGRMIIADSRNHIVQNS